MSNSRRKFLQLSGAATVGALALNISPASANKITKAAATPKFKMGIASYSLRSFTLEEAIEMTKRVGLTSMCLKSMHLPLDSSKSELKEMTTKVSDAGLKLYGGGVIYMKSKEQVDEAFAYAKAAGLEMIVGVPSHEFLAYTEEKVKEYDIIVAIHNHGPGDEMYPSVESIHNKIKDLDERIGICMDIGHSTRIGEDPSAALKKYGSRIYDMHLKDVSALGKPGKSVEIGRGIIDIPSFAKTLLKTNYAGYLSLEFEKDGKDPLAGLAESVGYFNGVIDTLT